MNSSLEKIFKMPTRQKIAVWVIVLVAIALGFYFLLIKSKQTELKDLQTKLNDLQTQIQENRKIADNLPVLQKEYNQLSMQLDRALTELPNQKEIPTLLTSITSAGKGAGSSTAAAFLREFVPKDIEWCHMDIANVAYHIASEHLSPEGASGFGVRLLDEYVRRFES